MAKPIEELFNTLSPEAQVQVRLTTEELMTALDLTNLRKLRRFTEAQLTTPAQIELPTVAQ